MSKLKSTGSARNNAENAKISESALKSLNIYESSTRGFPTVEKKFQKLIEKHDVREHHSTQFTAGKKTSFYDNFCKKHFNQISYPTLGPEERQRS